MPAKKSHTEHSPEVQEIMGHVPHWLLRWGVVLLFSIMLTLLTGSYFIQYPVVVNAPFSLTTLNSPAPLVVKKSGRVEHWLAKDGGQVDQEQLIAVMENESRYQDVLALDSTLQTYPENQHSFPLTEGSLSLGSVHPHFSDFLRASEQLARHMDSRDYSVLRAQILEEIDQKTAFYQQMLQHREIKRKEFVLVESRFRQDSVYYHQGGYGISLTDYESILKGFLQEKAAYINYEASFPEHKASIKRSETELSTLVKTKRTELLSLEEQLRQTRQKLVENIDLWKSQNIITAPARGILTLTKYWSTNQVLNTGESLATIVPPEQAEIIGRAMVDSQGIGRIKTGQGVNIKLSGFPPLEHGTLSGRVRSVSLVPEDEGYVVGIELSNGMTSTYKDRLKFIQEMDGTAEIITESKRLIYKLLSH